MAIVLISALAILLVYRYNRAKLFAEGRRLTAMLNGCPKCKANLRMRGFRGFRPCMDHRTYKDRIKAVRRAYA